jgi:hypothetical protein
VKISHLDKAQHIESKWIKFKRMREASEKTPRMDGYLDLNGDRIKLQPEDIDILLFRYGEGIQSEAVEIGLELDE